MNPCEMQIGQKYYVRTLTDHWVGKVVAVSAPFLVCLEEASWVADSGRLGEFMAKGKAANMEIEPVGTVTVRWESFLPWPHKLFKEAV